MGTQRRDPGLTTTAGVLRAVVASDGSGGGAWATALLLSHGLVVASLQGMVGLTGLVDMLAMAGGLVVGIAASTAFWLLWRRTWRRIEGGSPGPR